MNKKSFVDIIPQLETQVGITSLENLPVAIAQAEYYGIDEVANWFKASYDRLIQCIEREYSEEEFPLRWEDRVEDPRIEGYRWVVGYDETT